MNITIKITKKISNKKISNKKISKKKISNKKISNKKTQSVAPIKLITGYDLPSTLCIIHDDNPREDLDTGYELPSTLWIIHNRIKKKLKDHRLKIINL